MDRFEFFKTIVENDFQRVHVVDMESFEVVYSNKASCACAFVPNSDYKGKRCFEYFFGREKQCAKCPLRQKDISPSYLIEKEYAGRTELVHTHVFETDGRKLYVEYIEDVTDERAAIEAQKNSTDLISVLSENYLNIFWIDPQEKNARILKMDGYVTMGFNQFEDKTYDYATMAERYIADRVFPEDSIRMREVMKLDTVLRALDKKPVYSGRYRVLDNGEIHYYQYKYIRMKQTGMIIAGFSNVDDAVASERRHEMEMSKKNEELLRSNSERERQLEILRAVSDIYYSMHYIDLKENTTVEYSSAEVLKPYVNRTTDASDQLYEAMRHRTSKEYLEAIMEFVNLDTLPERLKNRKAIFKDFLNVDNIWLRAAFISIDVNADGIPESVIYTTQVVDEERRREEALILKSYTDELTRFYNRRAYERDILPMKNGNIPDNMVLVSFDLNGLKRTNDSMGHAVGDELIRGAVSVMGTCFGSYGSLYRTGGDEFMAIITVGRDKMSEILADFESNMTKWHSEHIDTLSISMGYVARDAHKDLTFEELEKIADDRMYKSKQSYYAKLKEDEEKR